MDKIKEQCIVESGIFGDMQKYLTVAEVINHLQTLNQNKYIYVSYDGGCYVFPPLPDETDDDGDYVIIAG